MPKVKSENHSFETLPSGYYTLTVIEAVDQVSKAGNEMIKVTFLAEGSKRKIIDYLVFTPGPCAAKVTSFQKAMGTPVGEDEDVEIESSDIVGAEVDVKLKVTKSEEFGDKNEVAFYCYKTKKPAQKF